MHFKDTNNNLHFLDDASFIHLLPSDCVEITEQEAEAIRLASIPQPTLDDLAQEAKAQKLALLDALVVTTSSGKTFDGNETARVNMLSAITASAIVGQTTTGWKLADNTVAIVTLDEVKEALALAIQRVGEIVTA